MNPEFLEMLRSAVASAGNQRKLATAIGVTQERISRVLSGTGYPLGIESCIRLALMLGEAPGTVLRAAGKHEVADLLDEFTSRRPPVNFKQRTLLEDAEDLEDLNPELWTNLREMIATSARRERERRDRRPKGRRRT